MEIIQSSHFYLIVPRSIAGYRIVDLAQSYKVKIKNTYDEVTK